VSRSQIVAGGGRVSSAGISTALPASQYESGRQDAALYGSQDVRRYNRGQALTTYWALPQAGMS